MRIYFIFICIFFIGCSLPYNKIPQKYLTNITKQDIVVFVVNKNNPTTTMTKSQLRAFFLAKQQYWQNEDIPVKCIHLPRSFPERKALYKRIMEKDPSSVERYWIKSIERGHPRRRPIIVGTCNRILNMLHRDKEAIGYVNLHEYEKIREKKHLRVKYIQIEGITPSLETAKQGKYTFLITEERN